MQAAHGTGLAQSHVMFASCALLLLHCLNGTIIRGQRTWPHLLVNDEEATKGNAVGGQHIVLLHNLTLQVRDEGVCQVTHSSLVAVCTRQ